MNESCLFSGSASEGKALTFHPSNFDLDSTVRVLANLPLSS